MRYSLLADAVVLLHALFIAFVVLGQIAILAGLVFRWSWIRNFPFRLAHLACIGIVVAQTWLGVACPLTVLENRLRTLSGGDPYPGDFIGFWLDRLIFFRAPPWVFVAAYSLFGALVVATFVLAPPRRARL